MQLVKYWLSSYNAQGTILDTGNEAAERSAKPLSSRCFQWRETGSKRRVRYSSGYDIRG